MAGAAAAHMDATMCCQIARVQLVEVGGPEARVEARAGGKLVAIDNPVLKQKHQRALRSERRRRATFLVDDAVDAKMLLFDSIVVVRKPSAMFSPATVPPRSSAKANSAPPWTMPPLLRCR